MADRSPIEWTDATVNAVNGCSVVSPGCTNCYAMKLAGGRLRHHPSRAGLTMPTKAGPVWTGEVRLNEAALLQPLRWRRPRRIFWNAHGDLFHPAVPDAWIDRCFAAMALTPHHVHQVLTKRPKRMRAYFDRYDAAHDDNCADFIAEAARKVGATLMMSREARDRVLQDWPLPNVWLGVSVEDQKRADERIQPLLETPAAVRFLSCEPLLGPLDLFAELGLPPVMSPCAIDWVIAGGESGPSARPMHPDWARSLRDQCEAAGVPFFFKQWGAWAPSPAGNLVEECGGSGAPDCAWPDGTIAWGKAADHGGRGQFLARVGKRKAGRLLDGIRHDGMPG